MFDEIKAIKSTRIILSFATEMTALYLWTEAIRYFIYEDFYLHNSQPYIFFLFIVHL